MKLETVSIRLLARVLERVDALVPVLSARMGIKLIRADVLRLALERGCEAIERRIAPVTLEGEEPHP